MNSDGEVDKFKWMMVAGVLFLFGLWCAIAELRYALFGTTTQATIQNVYEVTKRSRFGVTRKSGYEVEYVFTEADKTPRKGTYRTGSDWTPPSNRQIEVRYLPGADNGVRLAGDVYWIGLTLFVISLGVIGFLAYMMNEESKMNTRKPKKKKKRPVEDDE